MVKGFPNQMKPSTSKTNKWRKECIDWAESIGSTGCDLVRTAVRHKRVNKDLMNGVLHMDDLQVLINPGEQDLGMLNVDKIQHYPIINSKLLLLQGEESSRVFDWRVVVTNPTAISKIEEAKKQMLLQKMQTVIENENLSEEQYQMEMQKLQSFAAYEWQDLREKRGNQIVKHYSQEQNWQGLFNEGFMDAETVAEEIYQCRIIGGEPVIKRLDPEKIRMIKAGFSNRFEDADMIVYEDYLSPGQIIEEYYDQLTSSDIKKIENAPSTFNGNTYDEMANDDPIYANVGHILPDSTYIGEDMDVFDPAEYFLDNSNDRFKGTPYDAFGNIRVLKVYWKSLRMIKKIKFFNLETGDVDYRFEDELYEPKTELGEEETKYWVNEAWEGTKIGDKIYAQMRPCVVQFNSLTNPSKCHFGIIGSIYNLHGSEPYSLVDMMKPYAYLYDVIHERLVDAIANNWGAIMDLDLAQIPDKWTTDKWLYFAKMNKVRVRDSFKEGNKGVATGVLAASMNSNSQMGISLDQGNYIQQLINILTWIKDTVGDMVGITRQREGQIANRETVGGVERSTLQSSHITEWIFLRHEDLKRRVITCFLEYAKAAFKGNKIKFQNILDDGSMEIVEFDGDEFCENDYGLIVSNDTATQQLKQQIETLAQAALQNQTLSFSTIMKLYSTASIAEKTRMVENDERQRQEMQQQQFQAEQENQQQMAQAQLQMKQAEMQLEDAMNQRDNETKILIAQMSQNDTEGDGISTLMTDKEKADLEEKIREFDKTFQLQNKQHELDKQRLQFDKEKAKVDADLKRKQINKRPASK